MNKLIKLICAILIIMAGAAASVQAQSQQESNWWNADVWNNDDRGFNWYPPDPPPESKKEPAKKDQQATVKKPEPPKDIKKMKSIEEIKKEALRLRDVAIIDPTEKNVHAYLTANKYIMDKSAMFTDVWRRVVWQNPDVDYNTKSPQANFAQVAMKESKGLRTEALLEQLSKTHGVVFFFRSDCEFCHMQAPILKMMREQYNIEVLAVSLDGRKIKEFKDAKVDNGISQYLSQGRGIDTVPAMYLVSRDQKQVVPLGAGVLAMDEIVERIRVLYATKPGDEF